jgi:hypothetical protein
VLNLSNALFISTRSLRSRWRVGVEFDAAMIDEKYRVVISYLLVLDHDHVAIVQHEPVRRCSPSRRDRRPGSACARGPTGMVRGDPCASYPMAENSPTVWTAHWGITGRARSGRLGTTEGLRASVCFGPICSVT